MFAGYYNRPESRLSAAVITSIESLKASDPSIHALICASRIPVRVQTNVRADALRLAMNPSPTGSPPQSAGSSGSKIPKGTGIPVLTRLRYPNRHSENPVQNKSAAPATASQACQELLSEVKEIMGQAELKDILTRLGPLGPALQDNLPEILAGRVAEEASYALALPETTVDPANEEFVRRDSNSWTMIHRRHPSRFRVSSHETLSAVLEPEPRSRSPALSRSRGYRQSRSRRSRRKYVIPEDGTYKCGGLGPCPRPPSVHRPGPALNPILDLSLVAGSFCFGTEGLDKLGTVFIQSADRFCGKLCSYVQDLLSLWPNFELETAFDIFHEEISSPKFTLIKKRNPLGAIFTDIENLKFSILENKLSERISMDRPSLLLECKEVLAKDCALHSGTVYLCNGTMELGTCEYVTHSSDRPALLLKNKLMRETMVIRSKHYRSSWTDSDFLVFKLDEELYDALDEEGDGSLIGHISRRTPKVIREATFHRPPEIYPESDRLTLTFHGKLNSFSKGLILGASLMLVWPTQ